jgi:tetratricopeptide (TPR) repeat protein
MYRKEYPLASLGWVMYLALLAPTSSVVPIADTLAERRLYLPFLGLLLVLMEALSRVEFRKELVAGGCVALALCAGLTYQRSHVYASALALWGDSVEKNPGNGRAWFQYAFAQYESGQCAAALQSYEKTAALQKADYRLLLDWALAYDCANLPSQGVEKLRAALQLENNYHGWAVLGMLYGKQGLSEMALQALESSVRLKADYDVAHFYRGNVYMTSGRLAEAVGAYEQALRANPNHRPSQEALIRAKKAQAAPPGQ